MLCLVELEKGVWLALFEGDPGRTLDREHAKIFPSMKQAEKALGKARAYRPFKQANIQILVQPQDSPQTGPDKKSRFEND